MQAIMVNLGHFSEMAKRGLAEKVVPQSIWEEEFFGDYMDLAQHTGEEIT